MQALKPYYMKFFTILKLFLFILKVTHGFLTFISRLQTNLRAIIILEFIWQSHYYCVPLQT